MMVGGEAFSIDASLIKADINKTKRIPGDQPFSWPKAQEASHAVREYLVALDAARGQEDRGGDDGSGEGGQRRKPPNKSRLPIRKRHGLRGQASTHSCLRCELPDRQQSRHHHRCCGQSSETEPWRLLSPRPWWSVLSDASICGPG
jgi:hypothetical protein